jgi:hypothetical protein
MAGAASGWDAARPFVYYRAQVQPLPHWQVAPQRHPGLRVSVFFLDIGSSFVRPTLVGLHIDDAYPRRPLHLLTARILAVMIPSDSRSEESPAPLDLLVENHRAFLRYLERRVGDRELAEDIVQKPA